MNSAQRFGLGVGLCLILAATATSVAAQTQLNAYGTATTYYRVGTTEFKAYTNTDTYYDGGNYLWSLGPPGQSTGFFYATPHLPTGALVTYLELDYCDTNTAGAHMLLQFNNCDPISGYYAGNCGGIGSGLYSMQQPDNAPCAKVSEALNYVVDNATQDMVLVIQLGAFDLTNVLHGVVIGYTLQVSPPPANATFNDVPTNNPYFQFVEALAAAGITAGCGGGNYCPDAPVTRAQMAAFLAKALGLNWPQ